MEFSFTEKEEKLRKEIREFVRENLPKGYIDLLYQEEHDDEDWDLAMSTAKKLAEKRWLTIAWPKEFGGMDASVMDQLIFIEGVGYWGIPGTYMGMSGTAWIGPSIILFGTDEQKEKYLSCISSGKHDGVWCTGYSEPDAGSDLASLQTTAQKEGDEYVINGQKVWTSGAHRARYMWLACRTGEERHKGISILLVDLKSEGVKIRPLKNIAGFHVFNEVFFNNTRVPEKNLVGFENKGWQYIMKALELERGVAVRCCGLSMRLFDELLHYVRSNGLMNNPATREKLADLAIDIRALRILAYQAEWKRQEKMPITYEPSRDKILVDNLFEKLAVVGTRILGAYGQIDPLEKKTRWTKLHRAFEHLYYMSTGWRIGGGAHDVQHNIVAQVGLGLPKAY
jgi:alkylation response protein AidB-like acyl-CoA dehydrogenase